jgi:PD-(D/E)XK nuclease superfamily protein
MRRWQRRTRSTGLSALKSGKILSVLPANRLRQLIRAAAEVLAEERPDGSVAFSRLRDDLLATWRDECGNEDGLVRALEAHWSSLTDAAFAGAAEYDELVIQIDRGWEPAALDASLLALTTSPRNENAHTRAIGALIDPRRAGEVGRSLLRATLGLVNFTVTDDSLQQAVVDVEPEYRLGRRRRCVYPDLRIQLPNAVVLIENKIDVHDHHGQLDGYAQCVSRVERAVLVYLTPDGRRPVAASKPWMTVSYQELAIAWRRVLRDAEPGPWTESLRLYLATIVQDVWGVRMNANPSRATRARLVPYLKAAAGDS